MFKNLSIGRKLAAAFALVVAILIVLSAAFYTNFFRLDQANSWNVHSYHVIDESRGIVESLVDMETGLRGYALTGDEQMLEPYTSGITGFDQHLDKLKNLTGDNAAQQARLQTLGQQQNDWRTTFANRLVENRRAESAGSMQADAFTADFKANNGKAQMDAMRATVAAIVNDENALLTQRQQSVKSTKTETVVTLLVGAIIATVCAVGLGYTLSRAITVPLQRAVSGAEAIANGDLTTVFKADSKDEAGLLIRALENMQTKLTRVVTDIQTSAASIDGAAKEVASGNMDLSTRTEEQAASLEETAASMEQLTSTVRQNTNNSKHANQLAVEASSTAQRGGAVVEQVVETMSAIAESSQRVSDIIGTIEGIAFQTNILALNAAVEAARAGEQGRGFAVVAAEVRTLAQRSATAAKEIKDLISESVGRVSEGTALVANAGQTMGDIVDSIRKVADIMNEISAASDEQSNGIDLVGKAVTQMDEVRQQNAALVEQAAAAASSLEEQAERLMRAVSIFRTSNASALKVTAQIARTRGQPSSVEQMHNSTVQSGKRAEPSVEASSYQEWAAF